MRAAKSQPNSSTRCAATWKGNSVPAGTFQYINEEVNGDKKTGNRPGGDNVDGMLNGRRHAGDASDGHPNVQPGVVRVSDECGLTGHG